MVSLDQIRTLEMAINEDVKSLWRVVTYFLTDHVNHILNTAVRDDWENRRINDAQVFHAVHFETRVDDAFSDVFRKTASATGIFTVSGRERTGTPRTYESQSEISLGSVCSSPRPIRVASAKDNPRR